MGLCERNNVIIHKQLLHDCYSSLTVGQTAKASPRLVSHCSIAIKVIWVEWQNQNVVTMSLMPYAHTNYM